MNLFALTPVGKLEQTARNLIQHAFPSLLDRISYNINTALPYDIQQHTEENEVADGAYDDKTKTIYIHKDSSIETVIHEIGHAVHYQLFNAKEFSFSDVNKSNRAYLNQKEDFAEAFMHCVINMNNSLDERDKQVISILTNK